MAEVIGGRSPRLSSGALRWATTLVGVILAVAGVFGAIRLARSGLGMLVAVLAAILVAGVVVVGKFALDHVLLGWRPGRREEDTHTIADLLAGLPDEWWVFRDFFLGGSAVEFLVVGRGGVFAVEVYRWLARDTGTAFPERMAADLTARATDLEAVLGRTTGLGRALRIQPVYVCLETEGLVVGDLVLHPAAPGIRDVAGVIFATPENLLPLLRAGGPQHGVHTAPLDPDRVPRLVRLLRERTASA